MTLETLVELTPEAAERVIELRGDDPERSFLRVYVTGQGCSVRYGMTFTDAVDQEDEVVESHGVRLAVDPASRDSVVGVEIDFVDAPQGTGFMVRNPSAAGGGCGCGHGR